MEAKKQGKIADLDENIEAYEGQREELEKYYKGKYIIFYNKERVGTFDSFNFTARNAISRFGRGPYLIRQVGQGEIRPSSAIIFALA